MAISTLSRTTHSFKSTLSDFMGKTTARAALLVAGLLAVPLVVFTGSASATYLSCYTGLLCMYEDINFGGASYVVSPSPGVYNLPASWNDRISSVINESPYRAEFKKDAGCGSLWTITVKSLHNYSDFRGTTLNDEVSCYIVS